MTLPSSLSIVPAVITDSKGKYLHKLKVNPTYENKLQWHIRSERQSQDAKVYISKDIEKIKTKQRRDWIYMLIGTRDFTDKEEKYISPVIFVKGPLINLKKI